jgi:hypothetical protein
MRKRSHNEDYKMNITKKFLTKEKPNFNIERVNIKGHEVFKSLKQ